MSRLIDADALIADMEKRYCKDCERRKGVKGGKVRTLYEIGEAPCRACGTMDAMDEIDNASTIEAEPVRHGHWIEKDGFDGDTYYDCSACGHSWVTIEGTPQDNEMNYCPYCGAHMDEVSE